MTTLGEALTLRKRQAEKLNDLRGRIKSLASIQEGDEPVEDIQALLGDFEALSSDHGELVVRINRTNLQARSDDGQTVLDLLAEREHHLRVRNLLDQTASAAMPQLRFGRMEIKMLPNVIVSELRDEIERRNSLINRLDLTIQSVNWSTELL